MTKGTISRRSFMKAAAATGAALTAVGSIPLLEETDQAFAAGSVERVMHKTACHGCTNCCPVRVYTEDGRVVKIEGDPDGPLNKGGVCLKCLSQIQTVYSPRHILHPMKRVGERGENRWEAISWEEAVDLAGEQIATAVKKYGPYSYWSARGGGGAYIEWETSGLDYTFGGCNSLASGACQCAMPRDFVSTTSVGFNCCVDMDNVDRWVGITDNAELDGTRRDDTERVFVLWGSQPHSSKAAHGGHGLTDARSNLGVKTIVVDPYMTAEATKADVWLPVRPGSDCALMLSWIHHIIENNLYDEAFVKHWTNLPFLINPETRMAYRAEEVWPDYVNPAADPAGIYDTPAYVCFDAKTNSIQPFPFTAPENCAVDPVIFATATVNGKEAKTAGQIYKEEAEPWTLEAAGETCWLDPERIREAVELYANADFGGLSNGVFSDHQENSSTAPLGALAIDALLGYVESPCSAFQNHGAASRTADRPTQRLGVFSSTFERYGLGWTTGLTKAENDRLLDAIVARWDAKGRDGKEMQRYFFQSRCDTMGANEHKGIHQWQTCAPKELRQAITTGEPYRPRVMYEMSGNKYAVMGPTLEWKKAYDEQDFVIQQYPNMTSFTVQSVDLFLPTTEWLEYDSYEAPGTHFNRHYARCQVTHLGETVNPFVSPYQVAEAAVEKLGAENVFDPDAYKVPFYESLEAARADWAEQMGKGSWQEMLDDIDHRFTEEPMDDYMAYYQYKEPVSDGLPRGFATISRKVDVYSEAMLRLARTGFPYMYPFNQPACDDYDPICTFKEPTESPLEGAEGYDSEYPLVITTGRLPHFHHGTMRHAPFIREVMPAPELKINPDTAAKYGIEHLDWVKITSRRGSSNARAYLTQGIAPGVLITERFWNPECFDETQESITPGIEECGYNIMSADEFQNPCFATNSYRAFTVKIEKTERPERIWIESEQFQPFMPTLSGEPVTEEVF
ncbi:molybdopterin-containing oxidoreductase family protein [Parvibacter caecicola]|uniref:Anaerobic selenocysteine-containing dehydrogenase n=1 Tax=Parvibacter caecicola TaxID=747645 RepID=A0A7W5GQ52_9ACTN|nr:molybdopterin-dependent oxidoreductase [Parvibacter caecicola]MBB3170838.1 anaerobic selenocysteine-containing dehydrogenase [Parvibacter caecicola]MCR2042421.1 molybdopterin-dependent oxidoreductase [Parvibacter caecicola]RNL09138.1 molybdopterin dinucleotide-binding protein [Parvibacter caecicola]